MERPDLKTLRLFLVGPAEKYLEDMHEYSRLDEFFDFLPGHRPHKNLDETRRYLRVIRDEVKLGRAYFWHILLQNENKVIGSIRFCNYEPINNSVEIGYGISPLYVRKGYFSEALRGVMVYGFTKMKLNRLFAITLEENSPSRAGLLKNNFTYEGMIRQSDYNVREGIYHNSCIYGILKSEFEEII